MDTSELIRAINAVEGTDYNLVSRLPGGHQAGAYLITDNNGSKAVLKSSPNRGWLDQIERVGPILDAARQREYPATRYLKWGEVSGEVYLIYQYIPGESLPAVTAKTLPLILDLVDLQADLRPATDKDWSKYAYNVVFNNESEWSESLREHGGVARNFMDEVDRACDEFAGISLPVDDLVHGDFGRDNILWNGEKITGIIDMEFAGRGTRAIDLACLLESLGGKDEGLQRVLIKKIATVVGEAGLVVLFCYRAMAMVEWFLRQGEPNVAEERAIRARGMLTDLHN